MNAQDLHRDALVLLVHAHRPIVADLPLMKAGGVDAKVYQVTLDVDPEIGVAASAERQSGWLSKATEHLEAALSEIDQASGDCVLARSAGDVRRAHTAGKPAILLGAEGARWLEGSLDPLRIFHRLGLRELQFTWAFPNALVPDGRLSKFGEDVIGECERLGIVVDLTHIPPVAFDQVVRHSRQPLIVSHGSARSVTTDLGDDQIRALASTGGLVGIHFYTSYLGPDPTPSDVVRQVDYVANLVGIAYVALGVDFFPTDGVWRQLQVDQGTTELTWAVPDAAHMPEITEALVAHGFSEHEVRAVLGLNFLRILEEVVGE